MSDSMPLRASVVRITDADRRLVGMGYLVAPDTVITCAHVVADALDSRKDQPDPPSGTVRLNRPLSGLLGDKSDYREAQVLPHGWYPAYPSGGEPEHGLADIAILRILEKPYATPPVLAPLAPGPQFDHLTFETYGCPEGHEENATHTIGLTRAPIGNGRIQVESESGYRIEPGYSGAPVWCQQVRAIIGIIAQDERDSSVPAGFVIPSTLLLQACPAELREAVSQDQRHCRDSLVRGIDARVPIGADAIKRFLDTYLGRPEQPVPFGGRGSTLQALDDWLSDPKKLYQLLTAPAGRGKSALLAQWVISLLQRQTGWDIIFLPISIRFQTNDELTGLRSLAARLELFFPRPDIRHKAQLAADDYRVIIRDALNTLGNYPDRHFLLVVDAIDEAMHRWFNSTLLPYDPPPNLKILVSARYQPGHQDGATWLDELEWSRYPVDDLVVDLPPLSPQGISDVLACMGRPLDRMASQAELIEQLYRLSDQGDPLLVRLYTDQLWQQRHQVDRLTVEALQRLQPGFEGFLKHWYRDQARGGHHRQPAWEALFMFLAMALAPLKLDDLRAVAEHAGFSPPEPLEHMLADAFSLVIGDGDQQGYAFIHPRLNAHFLEQRHYTQERQRCERAFIDWCETVVVRLNSGDLKPESCLKYEYVLRNYVAHLRRGRGELERYLALLGEGWRRAWFALEGAYNGFLSDVQRVLEALADHNESLWRLERRPILRIGEEICCLLCKASVRSLSDTVSPDLIVKLVEAGIWYERQALRVIEQLNDAQKAEALSKLAHLLRNSTNHLHQALSLAERIGDESHRVRVLLAVAEHLQGDPALLAEP